MDNSVTEVEINVRPHQRQRNTKPLLPIILFFAFASIFILLAIHPIDRHDWMLEHSVTVLFVLGLIFSGRRFRLSNVSYVFIFLFLCLHTLGAHYTYSQVPYDAWSSALSASR